MTVRERVASRAARAVRTYLSSVMAPHADLSPEAPQAMLLLRRGKGRTPVANNRWPLGSVALGVVTCLALFTLVLSLRATTQMEQSLSLRAEERLPSRRDAFVSSGKSRESGGNHSQSVEERRVSSRRTPYFELPAPPDSRRKSLDIFWINLDVSPDRRTRMAGSLDAVLKGSQRRQRHEEGMSAAGDDAPPSWAISANRIQAIDAGEVREMLQLGALTLRPPLRAVEADNAEENWKKHFRNEYTHAEIACTLSHLEAIRRAYYSGSELALILEDDAELDPAFFDAWEAHAARAPQDWTILQWLTSNDLINEANAKYQDYWVSWFPDHYGTAAYMINREGMERILYGMAKTFPEGNVSIRADLHQRGKWQFTQDVAVADEVLYYLAGTIYTATRSLGLRVNKEFKSTIKVQPSPEGTPKEKGDGGDNDNDDQKAQPPLQPSKEETAVALKFESRKECILVLTNVKIESPERLEAEVTSLGVDMRALAEWNECAKWRANIVVSENLRPRLERRIADLARRENLNATISTTNTTAKFNKFAFMRPFVGEMASFDYILLKDADQRIAGFPWNTFMRRKAKSVIAGPLREAVEESLLKRRALPIRQYFKFHDAKYWKHPAHSVDDYRSILPKDVPFLEQYFVLIEGKFASDFFSLALTEPFLRQTKSWGPDLMWCGAVRDLKPNAPACSLVPLVSLHEDTRQINKREKDLKEIAKPYTMEALWAKVFRPKRKEGRRKAKLFVDLSPEIEDVLVNSFESQVMYHRWLAFSEHYRKAVASKPHY